MLRSLREKAGLTRVQLIATWGAQGAFALDTLSGKCFYEAAHIQPRVVDSVGAGDTFVAASIYALVRGCNTQQVLKCACAVAGHKVGQMGFDSLRSAVPADLL